MTRYIRRGLVAGLAIATAAQSAQAATACWDQQETAAAKVRDLQSRLMVATLRCKAVGIDISTSYNEFVRANRPIIQAANSVIKAQFVEGVGDAAAQSDYDSFMTALANAYGADATSLESCEGTVRFAEEAIAARGEIESLVALDERMGPTPGLPGGECPISFAFATED